MRAGEDPTDKVPGNKTAREQGMSRLVKELNEMKSAAPAGSSSRRPAGTMKPGTLANSCHDASATAPRTATM